MALQSSGQISLDDIRTELGLSQSNVSLGTMSNTAGFSDPDSISEFYGYSDTPTWTSFATTAFPQSKPCNSSTTLSRFHDGVAGVRSVGVNVRNFSDGTGIPTNGLYKDGVSGDLYTLTSGAVSAISTC